MLFGVPQYGYAGPLYCQRCSELFRDHIIRQYSNTAGCSRERPCTDCGKVLAHFHAEGKRGLQSAFAKMDASMRKSANKTANKEKAN